MSKSHNLSNRLEVHTLDDFPAEAAERFAEWSETVVASQGVGRVALAGGSTPKSVYEKLAEPPYRDRIAWPAIHFYQGDERPVPPDHPDSNWNMATTALLARVSIPAANLHRVRSEDEDLDAAARRYATTLTAQLPLADGVPVFDLILLGIGTDGHTASLFPDTPALKESQRPFVANPVSSMRSTRLTLTYPALNVAHDIWFLVTGQAKASLLPRILKDRDPSLPASCVQPKTGRCRWLLDRDAAAELGLR